MINGVYQIINLMNGKRYIGSASSPSGFEGRWASHKIKLNGGYSKCHKLQAAWNKYGAESFKFEILLICDPKDCLFYEQIYLDFYKPEYNIAISSSAPMLGRKHSIETRQKMSLNHFDNSGSNNHMYGKTHSQETKQKMSISRSGPKNWLYGKGEFISGSRNPFYGKRHTDEAKEKNRLAHTGRYDGEKNPNAKLNTQKVLKIRELLASGVSVAEIAMLFDVAKDCIWRIQSRKSWSNI